MDLNNDLFIKGTSCFVRVGTSASDAKVIGYVDSFTASKNIQLQRANVIGAVESISIDAQAVSATISMTGFLANKAVYTGSASYNGKGNVSLASFNPNSDDFNNGNVTTKFDYMDFYDKKTGVIVCSLTHVSASSFRISGNGGAYAKADIQMEAIHMSSGSEFTSVYTPGGSSSGSSSSFGTAV